MKNIDDSQPAGTACPDCATREATQVARAAYDAFKAIAARLDEGARRDRLVDVVDRLEDALLAVELAHAPHGPLIELDRARHFADVALQHADRAVAQLDGEPRERGLQLVQRLNAAGGDVELTKGYIALADYQRLEATSR